MIYKTLTRNEVVELNNELKGSLPGTAKIFYVIRTFLAGLLPGKEIIVDAWPEWTCIVVRTSSQNESQPFFRHTYMCHARSTSALKYFLQRPDVVNWRKQATFTGVPRDVATAISTMCHKQMGQITSLESRFMYAWTKKDLPPEPTVPEGLTLGELHADDAVILSKDWEGSRYREDLEGYFRTVIENFESRCLRDATGELLAYACMQFNGSIAMLYVKPEHRDKDYFKIVLADLARARLRKEEVAYGFIPTNDSKLVNVMRSMDFVWVPGGDMVWMDFEPIKVKRSNSPTSKTESKVPGSPKPENKSESIDCLCSDMAKFQKTFHHDYRSVVGNTHILSSTSTDTITTSSNVTTLVPSTS